MSTPIKLTGADAFRAKLKAFADELPRTAESLLAQEARAFCVNAGFHTMPYGFSPSTAKFQAKIAGDIRRIYLTTESIYRLTDLIKPRSAALAFGFYRASKAGKLAQANKYLKQAGISVEVLDPALHQRARAGPGLGVPKNLQPNTVVRRPSLAKYTRECGATIGTAKAGWYAAAKAIGGRVRSNSTDASGKRSTAEIFPKYIRDRYKKHPDLGGARVSPGRIEVFTNVEYAADALQTNLDIIQEESQEAFLAAVRKSLQALKNKHFRGHRAA